MKLKSLTTGIKAAISGARYHLKRKAPEIMLVFGAAATIGGVVAACKATIKAQEPIAEAKKQLEIIDESEKAGKANHDGELVDYTPEEAKADRRTVYVQTGLKLGKLYAPAFMLVSGGLGSMIYSNVILHKRLGLAVAAYEALALKFKKYREKVAQAIGPDDEKMLYCCSRKDGDIRDEEGNIVKEYTIAVADDDDYTALFSKETSFKAEGDLEMDLTTLRMTQDYWDDQLRIRGKHHEPVLLNEIRDALGLKRTQKGGVTGWLYAPDDPNHVGDNFIDFGINNVIRAYKNGDLDEEPGETGIMLSFNVDGKVLGLI